MKWSLWANQDQIPTKKKWCLQKTKTKQLLLSYVCNSLEILKNTIQAFWFSCSVSMNCFKKQTWFRFNFGAQSGQPIPVKDQTSTVSKALSSGKCDAVFMWWEIFMDPDKKVLLSCAPKWAHPDPKEMVIYILEFRFLLQFLNQSFKLL